MELNLLKCVGFAGAGFALGLSAYPTYFKMTDTVTISREELQKLRNPAASDGASEEGRSNPREAGGRFRPRVSEVPELNDFSFKIFYCELTRHGALCHLAVSTHQRNAAIEVLRRTHLTDGTGREHSVSKVTIAGRELQFGNAESVQHDLVQGAETKLVLSFDSVAEEVKSLTYLYVNVGLGTTEAREPYHFSTALVRP